MPSAAWREERWMNKVIWQKKHQKQGIIVKKRIYQDTVGVRLQSWVVQTASASILTFVQRGPEEDVLCMCERDEQTWPCFVLFISWPVHSNGADDVFTWRKRVTSCKVSQQKSSISELFFFFAFYGFTDRPAEKVTGNRMRERGRDTQQRAPGQESNLCTWDTCSTKPAKRHPNSEQHLCQPSRSCSLDWKRPARWGCSTSSTELLCYGHPSRRSLHLSESFLLVQLMLCSKDVLTGDAVRWMWCPEKTIKTGALFTRSSKYKTSKKRNKKQMSEVKEHTWIQYTALLYRGLDFYIINSSLTDALVIR